MLSQRETALRGRRARKVRITLSAEMSTKFTYIPITSVKEIYKIVQKELHILLSAVTFLQNLKAPNSTTDRTNTNEANKRFLSTVYTYISHAHTLHAT